MKKNLNEKEKKAIVAQYLNRQSVASLCSEYGIPRSTLYSLIKHYQTIKSSNQSSVSYKEYSNLKRRVDMLEERLKVIKAAGCGTAAPLQEKLAALEKLYGQYSVHALCEAFDVSRGTFYNHIFRKKDVTVNDKRREDMSEYTKEVFEDSH